MTQQPEALLLARYLDDCNRLDLTLPEAAAELRRLHEENEHNYATSVKWAKAFGEQSDRINTLEAALRQSLEALDAVYGKGKKCEAAITAAKKALGGTV